MRKMTIFCLLLYSIGVSAQGKRIPQSFDTALGDMKANPGTAGVIVGVNGLQTIGDDNPGWYRWDATSTASDNAFSIIQATGVATGRWIRVGNSNTIRGTSLFSSLALTSTYTINYNQNGSALPFIPLTVIIQARSANAAVPSWVTNITNTSFTVNFSSVPLLGTLNMSFDWIAVKQ